MPREKSDPDSPLQKRLAAHMRAIYVKMKWATQMEMADETDINQGHISGIMNGSATTGLETLIKLAAAGKESIDFMLSQDPKPTSWWYRRGIPPGPPPHGFREADLGGPPAAPPAAETAPPRPRRPSKPPPLAASTASPRTARPRKKNGGAT